MSNRSYLKGSILLCGESDHGKFLRTFTVDKIVSSSGSSTVCYTAKHDKSGIGVLKEFYPLDAHSLLRNEDGQLVRNLEMADENEKYEKLLADFIEPYQMLIEARKHGDLATFIPPFEIYYGCDQDCNVIGTTYIWSPEPTLETFDKVCKEIHEHPTVRPEFSLARVLYSIESLVKCICALHNEGLIHRDIKPSNFGFVKRGKELLTQTISLFDVDTICSVYNTQSDYIRGTDGYIEPEAGNKKPNNLTDIFSIGATLFHAIIVTDSTKDNKYIYDSSFYDDIKDLVDTSELIIASETNSHPHLRNVLTRILQKTLCKRDDRYQCCEDLLSDIQKALYYVIPAELADRGNAGEQWILADLEKIKDLDVNYEKNSTLALQYHLYFNPLYMNSNADKDTLDILIIGCGKYGQKFLDLALQIGQMPGKRLNVTVVSSDLNDRDVYLSERPELIKFFNIDGCLPSDPWSYGDIRFVEHTLSVDNTEQDRHFLCSLSDDGGHGFDYAFVATGRDSRNLAIARTIETICLTSFSWEGKHLAKKEVPGLFPVYVCENISTYPFFAELERMAFNVHLIWNKNLNINFSDVRKEFRKPYNHNSCVSFVLAMKYKLFGIGIDMNNVLVSEIAKAYLTYIMSHKDKKNELVYLEHRRWVTEKLCLGYTCITDLNECANGKMKDEKRKRHVCIIRSKPESALATSDWSTAGHANKKKWDKATKDALSQLDELDRMSVELHLVHLKHARIEKKNNILNGDVVSAITNHIERDISCVVAFQELLTCMKDIWNNDSEQWKRYEGLRRVFVDAVKRSTDFSERDQKSIIRLMDSLNEKFYPILASQQYRDYKKDDVALVEGIPFILTYSDALYMVIPYAIGNNTEVFANLAAPTAVNPSRLIYIAYCNSASELDEIRKTIPYVTNYMKKKKFRANVEFIVGYKSSAKFGDLENIEQDFKILSDKRIVRVKTVAAVSRKDFVAALKEYLIGRSRNKQNFLLESNETPLSGVMEGASFFDEFSSYSYDSAQMKFTVIHDCDIVKYIRVKPFITVTDMFAFKLSTSLTSNKPEFYGDYNDLWQKYRSFTGAWKYLCGLLKEHSETNDLFISFRRNGVRGESEYRYIVPFRCKKNISKILEALKNEDIIGEESRINSSTTHSCIVIIKDLYSNKKSYDCLFSRLDLLLQADLARCDVDSRYHVVKIVYNNLVVNNLDCKNLQDNGYDLLDFFKAKGYLISLSYDKTARRANFTYATPQIKDLLTIEGRMLEVYTYHKAKETGAFDDIRSSFEIDWEKSLASNEFDCVLTKGFSALFVECKATRDIKTEFYTKISRLAEVFGINAKAVLIADTQDTVDTTPLNSVQREHGIQLDVTTISNRADISNIGNVLLNLISKK